MLRTPPFAGAAEGRVRPSRSRRDGCGFRCGLGRPAPTITGCWSGPTRSRLAVSPPPCTQATWCCSPIRRWPSARVVRAALTSRSNVSPQRTPSSTRCHHAPLLTSATERPSRRPLCRAIPATLRSSTQTRSNPPAGRRVNSRRWSLRGAEILPCSLARRRSRLARSSNPPRIWRWRGRSVEQPTADHRLSTSFLAAAPERLHLRTTRRAAAHAHRPCRAGGMAATPPRRVGPMRQPAATASADACGPAPTCRHRLAAAAATARGLGARG